MFDIKDVFLPIIILAFLIFFIVIINNKQNEDIELAKKAEEIYKYNHCIFSNNKYYCWDEITDYSYKNVNN